ncbi:MAG: 16S rRNA (guanine(966)-N(2))-methyltransferase RsmD [Pseudomonadota bacterium]
MRIIGGRFRGTRLSAPGAAGGGNAHLRPTGDRVREALFNLLAHGGYRGCPAVEGARVLDLFAGTGALGLEALSRGAARAVFVDDHGPSRALIRENIERLGVIGETKIWRRDATRLGPCRGEAFDLVFADPPYRSGLGPAALTAALAGGWIAADALVVLELAHDEAAPPAEGVMLLDRRVYGEAALHFLRHEPLGGAATSG